MDASNATPFKTFITENLNPAQQQAVNTITGPLLIIAGAGSGKTRVITSRITHLLLNEHAQPHEIIALTFTNKAAMEMKERINSFLDKSKGTPFVGTFHSYCLSLLKKNSSLLPYAHFSILDTDDKQSLITSLLKKSILYKKYTATQISHQISIAKNQFLETSTAFLNSFENPALRELVMQYEQEKRVSNCLDFDDLLLEAVRLFNHPSFRQEHQERVLHILVDEYQDTNIVQHELLKRMALNNKNEFTIQSLCVVGDEDQSIYSWRGATVDNILHFKKEFKNTCIIKMEQNYRSKQPILEVANEVIEHNRYRNEKKLFSDKKGKDCVRMIKCLSGYQEADIVARYCQLLTTHKKNVSVGILYRTHFQSRTLEEALIKHSVAYALIGGVRFYERKEIKDILSYLRLISNPSDRVAFVRAINCPSRGLGEKFVEQFLENWHHKPSAPFHAIAQEMIDSQTITGVKAESVVHFLSLFEGISRHSSAVDTLALFLKKIHYYEYLKQQYEKEEAQERQENIKELLNAAHYFATQGKSSIESLLDEVALLQEKSHQDEETAHEGIVHLMTLHAAKGLEFDHVIIAGLEENLFPSSRVMNDPLQLEEERRLFYVGITRARATLLLTQAQYRQTYGQMDAVAPSRFSFEVPQTLCKMDSAVSWHIYEITSYFTQWLGITPSTQSHIMTFSAPKTSSKSAASLDSTPSYKAAESFHSSPLEKKTNGFKKHQTVKHPTFGIGIIQMIEERSNNTIVTAQFKQGIKKIDAQFLQAV